MKTIFDHIERVKAQPHHIRKQVAFVSAAAGAALIALVWLVGSITTGAFSIKGTSFASGTEQPSASVTSDTSASQNLAGAGAAAALPQSVNTPAHIQIIDATPSTANKKQAEQTTIPF